MRLPVLMFAALVWASAAQATTLLSPIFVGTGKMQIDDLIEIDGVITNVASQRLVRTHDFDPDGHIRAGMTYLVSINTYARQLRAAVNRVTGYQSIVRIGRRKAASFLSVPDSIAQQTAPLWKCRDIFVTDACLATITPNHRYDVRTVFGRYDAAMVIGLSTHFNAPRYLPVSDAGNASIDPAAASFLIKTQLDAKGFAAFESADLNPFSAVPLPAGLPLLLTGLAGLGAIARRRLG